MMKKLYIALWNWQNRHTTPRWISMTTGEIVSNLGRLMAGRYIEGGNGMQYRWESLEKYMRGLV